MLKGYLVPELLVTPMGNEAAAAGPQSREVGSILVGLISSSAVGFLRALQVSLCLGVSACNKGKSRFLLSPGKRQSVAD